jgi:hypothetical protein
MDVSPLSYLSALFLTLDMVVGLAYVLGVCVSVLGCMWCELVHE